MSCIERMLVSQLVSRTSILFHEWNTSAAIVQQRVSVSSAAAAEGDVPRQEDTSIQSVVHPLDDDCASLAGIDRPALIIKWRTGYEMACRLLLPVVQQMSLKYNKYREMWWWWREGDAAAASASHPSTILIKSSVALLLPLFYCCRTTNDRISSLLSYGRTFTAFSDDNTSRVHACCLPPQGHQQAHDKSTHHCQQTKQEEKVKGSCASAAIIHLSQLWVFVWHQTI